MTSVSSRIPARKTALCVGINDLVNHGESVGKWHLFVMDRALVDDKDLLIPQIKQLLPYITFVSSSTKSVLTYSRGKDTTEVRLRARSIGFGGHVDTAPDTKYTPPYVSSVEACVLGHLVEEAMREINEELPGFLRESNVDQLYLLRQYLGSRMNAWYEHAIDIRYAEVDSVHLGFSLIIDVDEYPGLFDIEALSGEANQVVDIRWVPFSELCVDRAFEKYEGWSQYVLWRMFPYATYLAVNTEKLIDAEPIPRFGRKAYGSVIPSSLLAYAATNIGYKTNDEFYEFFGVNI